MRKYIFTYDDDLICTKVVDGQEKTYYGEKAIALLVKKDKINFKRVRIHNNRIVMENKDTQIIIRDLENMYNNNIFDYFYNNINKINKAYNKKVKMNISQGQAVGFATVGIVAAIMLAITAGKIRNRTMEVTPIEFDQEEDYENDNQYIQKMVLDTDEGFEHKSVYPQNEDTLHYENILTNTNSLLDELDEEQALENFLNESQVVRLAYDNRYDQEKYRNAYDNYNEFIQERAPRWGVSPTLVQSMLTQESGGYYSNLMQIQFNSWHDQPITLFNYETGKMETIILTNHPENYEKKPDIQLITEKDLQNPRTNISVGCIILQYSFERMHHNIPAAIQCYNFGTSNMKKVLLETAANSGMSIKDLLDDQTNTEWLNYRDIIDVGDNKYLEHVLRYITDPEEEIWMNYVDENGEIQKNNITFYNDFAPKVL